MNGKAKDGGASRAGDGKEKKRIRMKKIFAGTQYRSDGIANDADDFGVYEDKESALASKVPMQKLSSIFRANELRERLLNYWTTITVVSALVAAMAAASFLNPPDFNKLNLPNDPVLDRTSLLVQLYVFLTGASFSLVLAAILLSFIYFAIGNQLPPEPDLILEFVVVFTRVLPLPTTCFVTGTIGYIISITVATVALYGKDQRAWAGYTVIVLMLVVILAVFIIWIQMQVYSIKLINDSIERKGSSTSPLIRGDHDSSVRSYSSTDNSDFRNAF